MVITRLTRNQLTVKPSGVRIPPSPPNKDRYFDTKRVEVTVFSFTQKTAQNKAFQRYCRKSRDPAGEISGRVLCLYAVFAVPMPRVIVEILVIVKFMGYR